MTLAELGAEYLAQEEALRRRLRQVRAEQPQEDDALWRRRVYYLAAEAAECKKIGRYLLHYYNKGGLGE